MPQPNLADLRRDYTVGGLSESQAGDDPLALFRDWFGAAQSAGLTEANAMTLATVGPNGRPSARIVLLKGLDDRGFTFFTNQQSRKAQDISANPFGALVFLWHELERQVRIEGRIEMVSESESDEYFAVRPRNSRLGAWASPQSEVLSGREELEQRMRDFITQYGEGDIPRPPHWGGYRLIPDLLEFWQGRPSRLHDRLQYRLVNGIWIRERLAP